MKQSESKKFRKLLVEERARVEEEMRRQESTSLSSSQRDSSGDLSGYSFHLADAATDTYEREFAGNLVTAEQKIIFEIDGALLRIEDVTYGICGKCNKNIGKKRLEIVPYARLCRKCKEKMEGE
jgi:RNA polymerase-binding protein DksA